MPIDTPPAMPGTSQAESQPASAAPPMALVRPRSTEERVAVLEHRVGVIHDTVQDTHTLVRRLADKDRNWRWLAAKVLAVGSQLLVLVFLSWNGLINSTFGQKAIKYILGVP